MKRNILSALLSASMLMAGAVLPICAEEAFTEAGTDVDMYRLYNPNSGEHFYTAAAGEKDSLVKAGWRYEGTGWTAPKESQTPVYRLYNANAGDHHYTLDVNEKDSLIKVGWKYEGIGWYSDDAKTIPLYRQYNPNAKAGSHNYTTNKSENDGLVKLGWKGEGIGWYGTGEGVPVDPAADAAKYWDNFLKNKEFKGDTNTTSGLDYVITDLSGDNIPELVLFKREFEFSAFGWSYLYTFDGSKARLVDSRYGYSCYSWVPSRKQIILPPETKPFAGAAEYPFATVQTNGLTGLTTLVRDMGAWRLDGKGVSEAQALQMLAGNEPLTMKLKPLK